MNPFLHYLVMTGLNLAICLFCLPVQADTEILFIRHGEKPLDGLGQLSCRGLNRSLALPKVLSKRFGNPDIIIAPNPGHQKPDHGINFSYVRPLATVEPTAILLGLPVNATIGYEDVSGLNALLENIAATQHAKIVLVAWEHRLAEAAVSKLARAHGNKQEIPKWEDADFDSVYVLTLLSSGKVIFRLDHQKLNNLPNTCP